MGEGDEGNQPIETLSIGELAERTGSNVETIRYYERAGILREPPRTPGGRRAYTPAHVRQLSFIRRSRALGFSLERTRSLLLLAERETAPCAEALSVATKHLEEVRRRIAELEGIARQLDGLVRECPGGGVASCPILATLAASPPAGESQRS